ncbi:unnamed protein product, partial [Allacma fusca]
MFLYSETFAKKGVNEHLANTRFERIYVKYPVPGHSRMPIDADFGLIESKKRRMEQIFLPSDIVEIVKSARLLSPFNVVFVNHPLTNNLCDDGTPFVIVKDYKLALGELFRPAEVGGLDLNSVRELRFLNNCSPIANFSDRFNRPFREIKFFSDNVLPPDLLSRFVDAAPVYDEYLPINLAKLTNMKTLLEHIAKRPE